MEAHGKSHSFQQVPPTLGEYEIHTAREGFSSIRHVASGEIMHSRTPPMEEARNLYIGQSHLSRRLIDVGHALVIWDVGLGAAANAMAAIECYEREASIHPVRDLQIVSFENDLDSLRLALSHKEKFPYLKHEGPESILNHGKWYSQKYAGLSWVLIPGDFTQTMFLSGFSPDIIFYDMFSRKTCSEAWLLETFRNLFEFCRNRHVEFFTYTCSTATRAALLIAGFHVAKGRNAGDKLETTIAFTTNSQEDALNHLEILGEEWLAKWKRSDARFPTEVPVEKRAEFEKIILQHPQFR